MPSLKIHLALANNISQKVNVSEKEFILGNVLPDVLNGYIIKGIKNIKEYNETHYCKMKPDNGTIKLPDFQLFLDQVQIDNDIKLGYFVHLLTDYYWNNAIIELYGNDVNKLKHHDFKIFSNTLDINNKLKVEHQENVIEKCSDVLSISQDDLNTVFDFFNHYKGEIINTGEQYQLFDQEQLQKIYDGTIYFVIEQINKLEQKLKTKHI